MSPRPRKKKLDGSGPPGPEWPCGLLPARARGVLRLVACLAAYALEPKDPHALNARDEPKPPRPPQLSLSQPQAIRIGGDLRSRVLGIRAVRWGGREEGRPELKTSTKLREVAKDDSLSMVFELSGGGFFATSATRGEEFARSALSVKTRAYPTTDEKKRMRIDYDSVVDSGAMTGWRVLRSTLVDAKGNKALLRTSFKVTELVTFDVALPESLVFSEIDETLSGSISVRSMGVGKIEGEFFANVPEGWVIEKGGSQRLLIYNPRGRKSQS